MAPQLLSTSLTLSPSPILISFHLLSSLFLANLLIVVANFFLLFLKTLTRQHFFVDSFNKKRKKKMYLKLMTRLELLLLTWNRDASSFFFLHLIKSFKKRVILKEKDLGPRFCFKIQLVILSVTPFGPPPYSRAQLHVRTGSFIHPQYARILAQYIKFKRMESASSHTCGV